MTQASSLHHLQAAIQTLTPLSLAENSWDNVGTIAEAPFPRVIQGIKRVVCCVDLTEEVTTRALADPATCLLLVYHPPIFSGLKRLTMEVALQRSILRSIASDVSIYCIHTAADNALNGVNDFIARGLLDSNSLTSFGSNNGRDDRIRAITLAVDPPEGQEGSGSGRIVTFGQEGGVGAVTIEEVVARVKRTLELEHVQIARSSTGRSEIRTIAICAGSGSGVLKNVEADLYVTGEFSHHDILAATSQGRHVITCNHSATERPWLKAFGPRLALEMNRIADSAPGESYEVYLSEVDREPLEFI